MLQRWRTCVSRAYYAIYSAATDALVQQGIVMPKGKGNPAHKTLPSLVGNNLSGISHALRWRLAGMVEKLYKLRLMADYQPQVPIEERHARLALGLMDQALECLRGES
ncbi:MAG: hypothetical protein FJ279_04145 [Planctomycetes bacterium]|nr:hypothetical protein [Planctomycetota bacterium]